MNIKNKMIKKILLSISILSFIFSSAFAGPALKIMAEDLPPMNYKDGKEYKGPGIEIVRAIQDSVGSNDKITVVPWKLAYNSIKEKKNTVLFSMAQTKKRKGQFKWVGPIAEKKYAFFAKSDSDISISSLSDAKENKIAVQSGGATEEYLKDKGFSNLKKTTRTNQSLTRLIDGEVELWYSTRATVAGIAKKMNIDASQIKEVYLDRSVPLYIAFNKGTPNKVISKWQKAYDKLYNSGEIKRIFDESGHSSLFPSK